MIILSNLSGICKHCSFQLNTVLFGGHHIYRGSCPQWTFIEMSQCTKIYQSVPPHLNPCFVKILSDISINAAWVNLSGGWPALLLSQPLFSIPSLFQKPRKPHMQTVHAIKVFLTSLYPDLQLLVDVSCDFSNLLPVLPHVSCLGECVKLDWYLLAPNLQKMWVRHSESDVTE